MPVPETCLGSWASGSMPCLTGASLGPSSPFNLCSGCRQPREQTCSCPQAFQHLMETSKNRPSRWGSPPQEARGEVRPGRLGKLPWITSSLSDGGGIQAWLDSKAPAFPTDTISLRAAELSPRAPFPASSSVPGPQALKPSSDGRS